MKNLRTNPVVPIAWMLAAAGAVGVGCGKQADSAAPFASTSPPASSAPVPPRPVGGVTGRCSVTTSNVQYDMMYFFPDRKELLLRTAGGMFYHPLNITSKTATSTDFTIKGWVDHADKNSLPSETGKLKFAAEAWSFDFERTKDADCTPDDYALTYGPITEAGIRAGVWSSKVDGFSLTVLADGQKLLIKTKTGPESLIYYRLLDKTDAGVVLGTSDTAPTSATGDIWSVMTLTPVGDRLSLSTRRLKVMLSFEKPPEETPVPTVVVTLPPPQEPAPPPPPPVAVAPSTPPPLRVAVAPPAPPPVAAAPPPPPPVAPKPAPPPRPPAAKAAPKRDDSNPY